MCINTHISEQLTSFADLSDPGYALLLDGPWGSGKTHTVKEWQSARDSSTASSNCLYVSLFGLKNATSVEDAIVEALVQSKGITTPDGFSKALEGTVKKFTGATVDLSGMWKRMVLRQAPRILIFDDLERAEMPIRQLFGALNRFVEHEKKNVVLIGNQAEFDGDRSYRKTREKVVGRVLSVSANINTALDAFLNPLQEKASGKYIASEREVVAAVFSKSGIQNLRQLRQSLHEFDRVYASLPDFVKCNKAGSRYLLATYLSLSLAFHTGVLGRRELEILFPSQDLDSVSSFESLFEADRELKTKKKDSNAKEQAQAFKKRWDEDKNVKISDETVLTPTLVRKLVVEGYADSELLEREFGQISYFMTETGKEPAWQTLWHWRYRDESDVLTALNTLEQELDSLSITEPTVILHVAGILIGLAKDGVGCDESSTVARKMLEYISHLEANELLDGEAPARDWRALVGEESAFGLGFAQRQTDEFKNIKDKLLEAIDRCFWSGHKQREENMLRLCRDEPDNFVRAISNEGRPVGVPNYAWLPVLADFDPFVFAETVFALNPEQANYVLGPMKERLFRLEGPKGVRSNTDRNERVWMLRVREEAKIIADRSSNIRAAQIRSTLKRNLDFLDASTD